MADKNMGNFMDVDVESHELKLYTFTTIDQKMIVLNRKILGSGKSAISR